MERVLRLERARAISADWVVRYENRYFQLEPGSRNYAPARGQVVVCEWPDGRLEIEYRGRAVRWREIAAPAKPRVAEQGGMPTPPRAKRKWVPPADHPWREAARQAVERKALRGEMAARTSLALPSASP